MFKPAIPLYIITLAFQSLGMVNAENKELSTHKPSKINPFAIAELWSTYSTGETINNEASEPQSDVHFRRLRFGAKGTTLHSIKYCFLFHADRIGENPYASTKNKYQGVGLWQAMINKRLSNNNLAHLIAGYYNLAVSRVSHTQFRVSGTLDKAQPDWYLRKFLSGKGNGIESGIGLGGQSHINNMQFSYRSSLFVPECYQHAKQSSLLYTGRFSATIGGKSNTTYRYLLRNENWVRQNKAELGLGAAYQENGFLNDSILFSQSGAFGGDLRLQYQGLILEGAYYQILRNAQSKLNFKGLLWHIKTLYNFQIYNNNFEACLSHQYYDGSGSQLLFKHIGKDITFDTGINWYIDHSNIKLALHHIHQSGHANLNSGNYIAASLLLVLQ